ncbi:phosphatidylglycerophosphatase A [Acidocella sp.]|uniref:phosphatidylglycerophosphatase A family protein n=1 Tax=Acidocella sp. TaxID=50710 RepID=UPI00262FB392|nr:phosphatidylglycerophosphatase A [Acidocella sp.]
MAQKLTPWRLLCAGLGAGLSPKAPGTAGSLLGLALGALLLWLGHLPLLFGIILTSALGVHAIRQLPGDAATRDPGWIVIDEIAGQMIPLLALYHVTPGGLLLSFALFRLFDILKPGPVKWADARHDAWGIMLDDLIAGALAWVIMLALHLVSPL